jgi:hypothetical protein
MDVSYHSNTTSRIPYRGYRYIDHYKIFSPPTTDGYAVPFTLNYIPGGDPFFRDIQPAANGELLPYWIEHAAGTTLSTNTPFTSPKIWVRLPIGCKQVDIYRNNPKITTDRSDGNRCFDFFDDFPGSSLDTTKWTNSGGTMSVTDSTLFLSTTSGAYGKVYTKTSLSTPNDLMIEMRVKTDHKGYNTHSYEACGVINAARGRYVFANLANGDSGNTGGYYTNNNGSVSSVNISPDWAPDYFFLLSLKRESAGNTWYQPNRNNAQQLTTTVPSDALPIEFTVYSYDGTNTKIYCDWVIVRKCQSPEPSYILQSTKTNPLYRG